MTDIEIETAKIEAKAWNFVYQRYEHPIACGFKSIEEIIDTANKQKNKELRKLYND